MAFSLEANSQAATDEPAARRVLLTGAAGRIGSRLAAYLSNRYDLTLMVRQLDESARELAQYGAVVECDLAELDRLKELFAGNDTIVHLAAAASPDAGWPAVLDNNIVGTYNVFVAARAACCRRVVFASSIHAVCGYPSEYQVKTGDPVNPANLYGVSKCFGEAMARYMAVQEGLSAIVVRIGAAQPRSTARVRKGIVFADAFVSMRDLCHLLARAIEVEDVQFAIAHAVSDNRFKRLDISDTQTLLGYCPQDDSIRLNDGGGLPR